MGGTGSARYGGHPFIDACRSLHATRLHPTTRGARGPVRRSGGGAGAGAAPLAPCRRLAIEMTG